MASPQDLLIEEALGRRAIACLATQNEDGSIHLTAVWFLYENQRLYVATQSKTRKARNLSARPNASLMVDIREPGSERGVCAAGAVRILSGENATGMIRRIHSRYLSSAALEDPRVGPVFASMDDVVLELTPKKWTSWDMRVLGKQLFGDALNTPGYMLPLE